MLVVRQWQRLLVWLGLRAPPRQITAEEIIRVMLGWNQERLANAVLRHNALLAGLASKHKDQPLNIALASAEWRT